MPVCGLHGCGAVVFVTQHTAFSGSPLLEMADSLATAMLPRVQKSVLKSGSWMTISLTRTAADFIDCKQEIQFRLSALMANGKPYSNLDDRCAPRVCVCGPCVSACVRCMCCLSADMRTHRFP